jgi:molybdenum cofactor cytidylyltransferase
VLAAGASQRLPGPKQLLKYRGETLLRRAARTAVEAACGTVVVVLASGAAAMREELAGLDVRIAENPRAAQGLSSSINIGIDALEGRGAGGAAARDRMPVPLPPGDLPDAVLFMTCDQPLLTTDVLRQLVATFVSQRPRAVGCAYAGTVGVPALFSRSLLEELRALQGDAGAKRVLQRHAGETALVRFEPGSVDIDTASDVAALPPGEDEVRR